MTQVSNLRKAAGNGNLQHSGFLAGRIAKRRYAV